MASAIAQNVLGVVARGVNTRARRSAVATKVRPRKGRKARLAYPGHCPSYGCAFLYYRKSVTGQSVRRVATPGAGAQGASAGSSAPPWFICPPPRGRADAPSPRHIPLPAGRRWSGGVAERAFCSAGRRPAHHAGPGREGGRKGGGRFLARPDGPEFTTEGRRGPARCLRRVSFTRANRDGSRGELSRTPTLVPPSYSHPSFSPLLFSQAKRTVRAAAGAVTTKAAIGDSLEEFLMTATKASTGESRRGGAAGPAAGQNGRRGGRGGGSPALLRLTY